MSERESADENELFMSPEEEEKNIDDERPDLESIDKKSVSSEGSDSDGSDESTDSDESTNSDENSDSDETTSGDEGEHNRDDHGEDDQRERNHKHPSKHQTSSHHRVSHSESDDTDRHEHSSSKRRTSSHKRVSQPERSKVRRQRRTKERNVPSQPASVPRDGSPSAEGDVLDFVIANGPIPEHKRRELLRLLNELNPVAEVKKEDMLEQAAEKIIDREVKQGAAAQVPLRGAGASGVRVTNLEKTLIDISRSRFISHERAAEVRVAIDALQSELKPEERNTLHTWVTSRVEGSLPPMCGKWGWSSRECVREVLSDVLYAGDGETVQGGSTFRYKRGLASRCHCQDCWVTLPTGGDPSQLYASERAHEVFTLESVGGQGTSYCFSTEGLAAHVQAEITRLSKKEGLPLARLANPSDAAKLRAYAGKILNPLYEYQEINSGTPVVEKMFSRRTLERLSQWRRLTLDVAALQRQGEFDGRDARAIRTFAEYLHPREDVRDGRDTWMDWTSQKAYSASASAWDASQQLPVLAGSVRFVNRLLRSPGDFWVVYALVKVIRTVIAFAFQFMALGHTLNSWDGMWMAVRTVLGKTGQSLGRALFMFLRSVFTQDIKRCFVVGATTKGRGPATGSAGPSGKEEPGMFSRMFSYVTGATLGSDEAGGAEDGSYRNMAADVIRLFSNGMGDFQDLSCAASSVIVTFVKIGARMDTENAGLATKVAVFGASMLQYAALVYQTTVNMMYGETIRSTFSSDYTRTSFTLFKIGLKAALEFIPGIPPGFAKVYNYVQNAHGFIGVLSAFVKLHGPDEFVQLVHLLPSNMQGNEHVNMDYDNELWGNLTKNVFQQLPVPTFLGGRGGGSVIDMALIFMPDNLCRTLAYLLRSTVMNVFLSTYGMSLSMFPLLTVSFLRTGAPGLIATYMDGYLQSMKMSDDYPNMYRRFTTLKQRLVDASELVEKVYGMIVAVICQVMLPVLRAVAPMAFLIDMVFESAAIVSDMVTGGGETRFTLDFQAPPQPEAWSQMAARVDMPNGVISATAPLFAPSLLPMSMSGPHGPMSMSEFGVMMASEPAASIQAPTKRR